jgi:mono/diheme cytochrome c family protein
MRRPVAVSTVVMLATVLVPLMNQNALPEPSREADRGQIPLEFQKGEAKFKANCARCHGERGVGTPQGPPLVHKIYEPSHHGDAAFLRAAANGVRAHHWSFGDMPRIESVSPEDVSEITRYVRWLQRQAGIQ